jgi:type I restriction enzyme M protein
LFRGGYDAALREKLIEKDWVEAVIQLPEKLLSNTNIETVLLVLNKAKDTNGVVRFVDARTLGQRTRSQTTLMLEDITLIRNLVMGIETDSQLSQTISLQQIKENKYNLHCNEYFASEIEETKLDLKAESDKLIQAQLEYEKAQQIFNQILSEV